MTAADKVTSTNGAWPADGHVLADGGVEVARVTHSSPSAAAYAVKNGNANGWGFWPVQTPGGKFSLATLRARYADARGQAWPPGAQP